MINPEQVSRMLTAEQIDFVPHSGDDGQRWLIIYSMGVIVIELSPTGEQLRFRTGPIANSAGLSADERNALLRRAMLANDHLMIGRYCGTDQIDFEIGMSFPGQSSLSREQLMLGLQTAVAVASSHELV